MRRAYGSAAPPLFGKLDALPERHPPTDHLGLPLWVRVVPDRVPGPLAIYQQGVVAGLSLPRARGLVVREGDVALVERVLRKVGVGFDPHGVVALRDDRA